jgi:hypothetical protein
MKASPRISLFLGLLACSGMVASAYAGQATVITSFPLTINVPGKYVLNQDLTLAPGIATIAIQITCGDVTVDLNGHTITGPGNTGYKGFAIRVYNIQSTIGAVDNIVIKNGILTNFRIGVLLNPALTLPGYGATNCVVKNLTISAVDLAVQDLDGVNNNITNCTFVPNPTATTGVDLLDCTGDLISGNRFLPWPVPSAAYQDIIIQGKVQGNQFVNNEDVTP